MPTESFLVTALPYSAAPGEDFHVSLFVTHRLTPDGAQGVLSDFVNVRDWTTRLANATFRLWGGTTSGANVDIPVTPRLEALDARLWPRVFPRTLPVRPFDVPELAAAPWQTFPAHRMQAHALLVHAASIFSSPVEAPSVAGNALTGPILGSLGLTTRNLSFVPVIEGRFDREITARLDGMVAQGGLAGGILDSTQQQPLLQLVADVHRARQFYQRTEDDTPYQERPTEGATGDPVTKPEPDFHERAALLGDLSPLLRRLGLVIDLRVDDLSRLTNLAWIQADLTMPRLANTIRSQPRTACRLVGQTFTATSSSGDFELGMLRLADESRFRVLDLDPDASALKLEQFIRTVPRLAVAEQNGDAVNSAPASLRATGFAVAQVDRAAGLHSQLQNAAAKDAALRAGTAPPLTIEQISRGVRLEVWDDASNRWHSLHRRMLSVDVERTGSVLEGVPDTGFLQGASLTQSDTAPTGTKYAHEVMAGWDGWSLSAPRPGRVVVHDGGDELVLDEPPADPNPVNPVSSTVEVAPGTLPRLRYGRRYAFRAYAVDLAGNSRPHEVAGPPVAGSPGGNAPRAGTIVASNAAARGAAARAASATSPADVTNAAARAALTRGASTAAELAGSAVGGVILDARSATAQAESRLAGVMPDATLSVSHVASAALRESIRALRPPTTVGPQPGRGAPGVVLQQVEVTAVPDVDRVIATHINERAQLSSALGPSRSEQIAGTFAQVAAEASSLMDRTDIQTPAEVAGNALSTMLAQQPGLAAAIGQRGGISLTDLVAIVADLVTTPRPFLRWDPVIEPATVPRRAYTEGESLLRLVIRSGVEQATPGALEISVIPPAEYVADVLAAHPELDLAWREDSQRHLAPPKTSQLDAELHGMLDAAFGSATPGPVRTALGVSLRESGSFLDTTVADIANPGQRLPQPGVTFHTTPTAEVPEHPTPDDLPDGDPLSPGQYVAHDVDQLVLPYLPDPLAAGVSFTFPDTGKDHRLAGLLAIHGTTLRYVGEWPERVPYRLVLEAGDELGAVTEGHVVRIALPPGEQLRMRMSSSLEPQSLNLLGLWRSLPQVIREHPLIQEAARDGWFWWLTPSTEVRLVHATPRPVEAPRPTILVPLRTPGDTAIGLIGGVDLHGPSTSRIDVEATWTQWVDDVAKPEPEQVGTNALAAGTLVDYDEDLVVLAPQDATLPLPNGQVLKLHGAVHQIGDTKHRMIDYSVRATTRYKEYFSPQVTPEVGDLSVVGPTVTLNVPSTARPAKVLVRDVLPLFRWEERTEPEHPFAFRRVRRSGVRIYLERPWYLTGDNEQLGVLVAFGSDAFVHGSVSQWAADPVFRQQGPQSRSVLPLSDLLHTSGLDDRIEPARPAGPPVARTLVDLEGQPTVWVLGYRPEFSPSRSLWFVDVAFDPGSAFWPFVQLSVARFQPSSLPGLHLGPITMCDFVQLPPERIATLSRTDETHAHVVVTGPVGHPRIAARTTTSVGVQSPFLAQVAATRTMRARLERFDASVGTDLGWVTLSHHELPILGAEGTVVSWAGEIELPVAIPLRTPGTRTEWRVTLEEWEYLPADTGARGTGGLEPRVIYADHLPM